MKKGIIIMICGILTILLVSCGGTQDDNKELIQSIEKTINETFNKSEELEKSNLQEEDFWNSLIAMYEDEYKFFYELDVEAIEDNELKKCITDYLNGAKIRVDAYKAYKIGDTDTFEKKYEEFKEEVDGSLIKLVEKYNLKIDYENKDMYKFIKERV